tara:strand:+ start:6692 stop:7264 length:573 start_codon:yes stop_codon:yes gene_type:complete
MNSITQKKEHIILTAIELFANQGVGVSTAEIAKTADIANGTLFYNFETKQDLIDAVFVYLKQDTLYAVIRGLDESNSIEDKMYMFWENYIEWAINNKSKHKALAVLKNSQMLSPCVIKKTEEMFQEIYQEIDNSIKSNDLKEIPFYLFNSLALAQLTALLEYINKENLANSKLKEITKLSYNVFFNGVKG